MSIGTRKASAELKSLPRGSAARAPRQPETSDAGKLLATGIEEAAGAEPRDGATSRASGISPSVHFAGTIRPVWPPKDIDPDD